MPASGILKDIPKSSQSDVVGIEAEIPALRGTLASRASPKFTLTNGWCWRERWQNSVGPKTEPIIHVEITRTESGQPTYVAKLPFQGPHQLLPRVHVSHRDRIGVRMSLTSLNSP